MPDHRRRRHFGVCLAVGGGAIAFAGLWMMLYPPLKRWWKSDQTQMWWETGKKEPPSGEAPEDGKNSE